MAAAGARFTSHLFNVAGKVVIVTGGSRGIGLMIAEGFVSAGARVYITSRKAGVCDKQAARLTANGPGSCVGFAADVATTEGRASLLSFVGEREAKVHVLVNNAGCNWVRARGPSLRMPHVWGAPRRRAALCLGAWVTPVPLTVAHDRVWIWLCAG